MLSVNEGTLPSVTSASSFIPYSIREAFGLPVINHQESIYAYHFYRLLHRAENVTFVYNSASEGLRTGERSRFLIQMKYEQIIKPEILNLSFDIKSPVSIGTEIERNDRHRSALYSSYVNNDRGKVLSPTAVNTWLNCRMKFYYRYVNGLKEAEIVPVVIDHAVFGQLLHRIMKIIYEPYRGKEVTGYILSSLIEDKSRMKSVMDRAVVECFNYDNYTAPDGNEIIIRDVLNIYLLRILEADRSITPFRIIAVEEPFQFRLPVVLNGESCFIIAGGNVDRIDHLSGTKRIVDYKTGVISQKICSISELFEDDRKKDPDGWLQTLLYCEAYLVEHQGEVVRPSIYKIKELTGQKFSDRLRIRADKSHDIVLDNYETVRNEFLAGLKELTETVFSDNEPFRMTKNTGKCVYCPFRKLCQR
jgi:CRISPR/Cas system-associated exonuclease Cas4 (RecB family)